VNKSPLQDNTFLYPSVNTAILFLAGEMYYDEVRTGNRKERKEEKQYCKLYGERFLQKPISNAAIVKRINNIMMLTRSPFIQNT
jgi:hypothetical protein